MKGSEVQWSLRESAAGGSRHETVWRNLLEHPPEIRWRVGPDGAHRYWVRAGQIGKQGGTAEL